MKKQKWPKKAKLVTDAGFYRIVDVKQMVLRIKFPLVRRIKLSSPETYDPTIEVFHELVFDFTGDIKGGYAIFKQTGVVSSAEVLK